MTADKKGRDVKSHFVRETLTGSLAGAMLTAALISVFYAGWKLAGLSFVPFDVFDWIARVLPGGVIEFVISIMVAVIQGLHLGPTSVVAKGIEQAIGILSVFVSGLIGGAVLFALVHKLSGRFAYPLGLAIGIAAGLPALLISYYVGQTASAPAAFSAIWILLSFLIWGAALGYAYQRLFGIRDVAGLSKERISAVRESVEKVNRRQFLIRLAGTTATITVAGAVIGRLSKRYGRERLQPPGNMRWSANHSLPNAEASVRPAPGTRSEYTPIERHYRIDIDTIPPSLDESRWKLKIKGLVERPLELTLDQIRSREAIHQFITLSCISNIVGGDLIGTTRWTGVSLKSLLPDLRVKPGATHLKIRSADGFWEVVSLATIRSDERLMLAYAWDGVPLLPEHGFPLRLYIPDLYGMKQPKWIESIEVTDRWEPGYWVVRGWDEVARMKATSVIDTVHLADGTANSNIQRIVSIGGIAHAGARGISRVELQIDGGPWHQAALRTPLSGLTWVIWRYDWPFNPGRHTFTVRCYDGSGRQQITESSPAAPSGATGLHRMTRKF